MKNTQEIKAVDPISETFNVGKFVSLEDNDNDFEIIEDNTLLNIEVGDYIKNLSDDMSDIPGPVGYIKSR